MEKSVKLQDFIKSVSDEVSKSQKSGSFELLTPIDFEISISVKKEGKGGIELLVVGAGGKYEKNEVSRIRFSLGDPHSLEQVLKIAKLWQTSSSTSNENIEAILRQFKQLNS